MLQPPPASVPAFLQQDLLQTAALLQSDLQEALQASRTLTDLLEPPAAGLVQSELRLLSRDLQEISCKLNLKLGRLQVGADEGVTEASFSQILENKIKCKTNVTALLVRLNS